MNQLNTPSRRSVSVILPSFVFVLALTLTAFAQTTAITYQGRLTDSSAQASGTYQMNFSLFSTASGGSAIQTVSDNNVQVTNGAFTVQLNFTAANAFDSAARYLEIEVRKVPDPQNPPAFTVLTPRQQITSAPYAVRALNAGNVEQTTAGNSVVNSINNAATNTKINSDRLSPDVVRLYPASAQIPEWTGRDNILDLGSPTSGAIFQLKDAGGLVATGDDFVGPIPKEGAGTRLMWYPGKGAFRAGRVNSTQWNDINVGMYSIALGFNSRASGDNTFAVGPGSTASQGSAIALGENNTANSYASIALGYHAMTNAKPGSFVFGDFSTPDYIRATVNNQFVVRAQSFWLGTQGTNAGTCPTNGFNCYNANNIAGAFLTTSTGAYLSTGGTWTNASSRNLKTNFAPVDAREVLSKVLNLPIQTWNYKAEDRNVRHIGAFSQDFYKTFNLGNNDESISTVDADGVALAAIQGLNEELKLRDRKIAGQQQQLEALQQQVKQQQALLDEMKKLVCAQTPDAALCRQ